MIIIDPSSGGSDSGVSANGIIEKDFNLLISNYIYDRLNELNADVKLIRESDEYIGDAERINRILNSYGNNSKVILLSNKLSNEGNGVEIIYALRNKDTLEKSINDNLQNSNINVSKYYQRRSENDTSKDYYDIQRNTGNLQTIIVDYGNINNKEEADNLKNNYKKYAESVIKALVNYQGIPYFLEGQIENNYVVKKGDSLYSIANTYNTTVDELKKINNLKSNILQIGQILSLPQISSSDINQTYIVQKGDNLYKIASSFNTTVDELKKINNLSSNLLQIGQILQLTNVVDNNIYTVKKGDSLYKIATIYNTTVDNLKKLNNLTSNSLSVGQKLKIPILNTDSNIYVVKKGDNLYNIANNFNTTVDNIKKLNNLSSNLLQIGQQLIIPN